MMRPFAAVAVASLASACLPYSPMEAPTPPVDVPDAYASGGEAPPAAGSADPGRWWRAFEDPALTALEEEALAQNLELRAAWARLTQAQALAEQAGAPRWPQVSAELSAGRQRQLLGSFGAQEFNRFSASLSASYELDLFDRIGAEATAADLDAWSARDDVESLAMTLSARIAEAWFDLVQAQAERRLLEAQLEVNETFLELVQLRFGQGFASALDVYQQQQQITATRARLVLVSSKDAVISNQLDLLVGHAPRGPRDVARDELPALPPLPAIGLPAELMERRPDVRAARRRVIAADYRVGAAVASWFPSIRLSGSIGLSSTSLADLLDDFVYAIAASISETLIDGGRRSAEIDRREAVVRERLQQYGQSLLVAMVEVDNALAQERQQLLYIEQLEQQVENASSSLREARARYREGLSDFLPVLTALNSLQQTELSLLGARRQLISYRIQLARALGGAWTAELGPPPDDEEADDTRREEDR